MSENPPRKHHYVPVFYLKQWANAAGTLCEYRRALPHKIVPHRKAPAATGFKPDLYKVDGAPASVAQVFESTFMSMLDDRAALVLQQLADGASTTLDPELRSAWTRFILSLRFRNPEAVAAIKSQMVSLYQSVLADIRMNYRGYQRPGDPDTFEEFAARMEPEAPYKAALMLLQGITDNPKVGQTIFDMHWTVTRLNGSNRTFLTSDRPLVWPLGLSDAGAHIAVPVGPKLLFVAAHDDRYSKKLAVADPTTVVETVNKTVVEQARKMVWGVDDTQLRFVQNRMSKLPDRPIISEEQKQNAIQTARVGAAAVVGS